MQTKLLFISFFVLLVSIVTAENDENKDTLKLDTIASVKTTSVKDQHRSGTCWSYAACSFIESELIRKEKGKYDLSEMFFVHRAYSRKAKNYVRLHGKANFSAGGQAHDVIKTIKNHGIITEGQYSGMIREQEKPNHSELDKVLKGYVDGVLAAKGRGNTSVWHEGFQSVLDIYLGAVPENFTIDNKSYNPESFTKELNFNPDDYVELTSYSHHPFYEKFRLEIPDNWDYADYYNVPIDELMKIMENSLKTGYSISWDGDVSDKYFDHKAALAIVPENEDFDIKDFDKNTPEKSIDQDLRQKQFNTFKSTDDHLMHITGLIKDENGRQYFVTKNSWDTDSNDNDGYLNMTSSYVKLNTVAIMVHKDAIPGSIREKLNL
ncbi:MAG: C1 family peptidase [Bacteroidales bacterium]